MQHYLEIPFIKVDALRERHKITPIKGGLAVYSGATIPRELRPYQVQDFSLGRWMEDERNALVLPPSRTSQKPPLRPHNLEGVSKLLQARESGARGFLCMDPSTLNPRLTLATALKRMAKGEGYGERSRAKVLILCAPGNQESWRQLLYSLPSAHAHMRFLILDHRSMEKVISAPPQARISPKKSVKVKITAAKGVSSIEWQYIIVDDSQDLRGHQVQQLSIIAALEETKPGTTTPFIMYSAPRFTLEPGRMAPYAPLLLPHMTGAKAEEATTPQRWPHILEERGITLMKTRSGEYRWSPGDEERKALEERYLRRPLRSHSAPTLGRRATAIPRRDLQRQSLLYIPSHGDVQERYLSAWAEISQDMLRRKITPTEALALHQSRMGYLKIPHVVKVAEEHILSGALLIIKAPSKAMGEAISQAILKKRIPNVVYNSGEGDLSSIASGKCSILIATGDLTSLHTEELSSFTSPTVLALDHLTPGHPGRVAILEKKFNDPYVLLPAFSNTLEERLARHAMEASTAAERAALPGRLERAIKAASARTPAPGHLS